MFKIFNRKKSAGNSTLPTIKGVSFPKYIHIAIVFLLTIISTYIFANIGVDGLHDGILFKPATDVANGLMIFRDTFTQYGALTTLIQALALKIFGNHLIVIRYETVLFYGLISILLWVIWSRFLPRWLTTISCIIWILMAPHALDTFLPWSSVFALFFQLLCIYFIILHFERNKSYFLLLAGAAASLTFWCRQPVGVLLFIALFGFFLLYYLLQKKYKEMVKSLLLFSAGFIAITFIFFVWLIVNNALRDWWLQSIKLASYWAKSMTEVTWKVQAVINKVLPAGLAKQLLGSENFKWLINIIACLLPLTQIAWLVLPVTPVVLTVKQFLTKKMKNLNSKEVILFAFSFVCIASWAQYYPINCNRHHYWAATPMFGLFSFFVWDMLKRKKNWVRITALALVLLLVFGLDIKFRVVSGFERLSQTYTTVSKPESLQGLKLKVNEAENYAKITDAIEGYMRKYPGSKLITVAGDPIFLTFTKDTVNFHPMYINLNDYNRQMYPDYFEKLDAYIGKEKPLIITDYSIITGNTFGKLGDKVKEINDYELYMSFDNNIVLMVSKDKK